MGNRPAVLPEYDKRNRPLIATSSPIQPRQNFWGLFTRKERWGLSWRGWLIVSAGVVLTYSLFWFRIYPFLATTQRVDADVLVVEGWVHEYAIEAAADEFRSGSYRRVFTTGGPVTGTGRYINDFQTSASVGADLLKKAGVPGELLQMVPSRTMNRDRTYSSAIALRDWIQAHQLSVRGINVVTENTHARRTRLLFQKAFGNGVQVGIIAVPNPDYPANRWWRYSEGLKDVVSESAAYLYARFLFSPLVSGATVRARSSDVGRSGSPEAGVPSIPRVWSIPRPSANLSFSTMGINLV